ncbi:MAG: hypothetical protein PVH03_08525 [Chloroflexota bacterium]|jgi:hypothetical protein
MLPDQAPNRVQMAFNAMIPVYEFFGKYEVWTADTSDDSADFTTGNPHEMPGYFRISLTANDEMIERAIPRFAKVRERVLG